MKSHLISFLVFLSILHLTCFKGLAQRLRFEHLTIEHGLTGNNVWSIIQDSKGYMWFGTLDGLNKYDGYTITTFQFRPHDTTSISQNIIFTLYEDSGGLIWIGTTEGGICKFNPFTQVFTTYKPPQSKNQFIPPLRAVSAIVEDKEGRLWVSNFGGELRCFDKKTSTFSQPYILGYSPKRQAIRANPIFSIYKDRADTLWVGNQTGLHKLSFSSETNSLAPHPNVRITHYQHQASDENSLSNNSVTSIYEDQKGMLWVGTQDGLNRFDRKTGTFTRYLHDPTDFHSLSHNNMWLKSITEDKGGNLWVGTANGLNRLDSSRREFTRYYHDPLDASTLGNNYIYTLYMDKAGNLWIGTDNGISRLDFNQKPFALYRFNPAQTQGLNGKFVSAICEDRLKNLWIGTEQGLNHFNTKTGRFTHHQHNPAHHPYFTADKVNAIIEDSLGTIWVLNPHKLSRFTPSTGELSISSGNADLDNLLKDEYLNSLYQDSRGTLWIGMATGMCSFNPGTNQFKVYRHDPQNPDGLSDFQVNCIREDKEGNLWIGQGSFATTKLNRKTGRFSRYVHNPLDTTSISSNTLQTLFLDTDKNLWLGTAGGGLCRYNYSTQTFTTYAQKQGLADGTVNAILQDGKGNLWLSTNKGISRFSPATGKFTNYDAADGLQSNIFLPNSAFKSKDGTLYFGGINGMNAFNPEQLQPNVFLPPVVITKIKVFDQEVPIQREAREMELEYDQNFFSFEFAALNYTNANKNQYAYQLEGVDKDWVYSGTRRFVSYSDVVPGRYIFKVKGSNNDGIWNQEGTSLYIFISPPWWQTWWFTSISTLVTLGLVYGGFRYRVSQVRKQEQQKANFNKKVSGLEMQALRAQMNPHFIFNSLNSINCFILKNNPEAASDYLSKFSRLIRLILQNSNTPTITLENELEALNLYLEMEALRFKGKFTFSISYGKEVEVDYIEIPPLIIQPYVENAIWHGLMHKEGMGHIHISVEKQQELLTCTIEDDGIGRVRAAQFKSKSATKSKSLGMQITAHRLELLHALNGKQTRVEVVDLVDASAQACGTKVILSLPIEFSIG